MNDFVVLGAVATVLVAIITIAKFWMDLGGIKRDAVDALKTATDAEKDLADFKTTVAEKYPSMQMLAQSEGRLAQALDAMRGDVTRAVSDLTSRIDRILSARTEN